MIETIIAEQVRAGDPFAYEAERDHFACIEAMHAEEERLGRKMTHREMVAFATGFHAPAYRSEIRSLARLGIETEEEFDGS
jgi:hypothetical protein